MIASPSTTFTFSVAWTKSRKVFCSYLDSLIPTAGCQNAASWCLDPFDTLYGCVVLGDLGRLASRNIEGASSFVCATRKYLVSILWNMARGVSIPKPRRSEVEP